MWRAPRPEGGKAGDGAAALGEDLPGLVQQVAVEALAVNIQALHGRLDLIVAHQRYGIVQVVEEHRLFTTLI